MRVLIAPDGFDGTLTAQQAATAMAAGWRSAADDQLTLLPLADGGPGFVDVLHAVLGGELIPVTVTGPLGEPLPATVLRRGAAAFVESAQAVGLHLLDPSRRDPARTTSFGVGELIRAALETGARQVVVGLGGSATNDGGAGMLAGLGLGAPALRGGGGGLSALRADDLTELVDLRRALADVELVGAADVDVPLLGLTGASAGFAAQKGATPAQAQALERNLAHFARVVAEVLSPGAPARAPVHLPGAGAAGGVGFGIAALGGALRPGAELVAHAVELDARVADADLVVTGEGTLDWQSLHGKVVSAVTASALSVGVPVVVIAGRVNLGRREWSAAGISGVYPVAAGDPAPAFADPVAGLVDRAERVARTWSR